MSTVSRLSVRAPALTALLATFALAFAPASGWADDIDGGDGDQVVNGTPDADTIDGDDDHIVVNNGGNDTINGDGGDDDIDGDGDADGGFVLNSGDDTINGGDGDDTIDGDGDFDGSFNGRVEGGDDIISGGDGNDNITGDGDDLLSLSLGPGYGGTINGGHDIIHGDAGDDLLIGDGLGADFNNGGNDQLFGDAGNDQLFGQTGNDLLCGGVDTKDAGDTLTGGDGVDLACAHNDATTVDYGIASVFNLTTNDEQLDDEGLGEDAILNALMYALVGGLPSGVTGTLDPTTGMFNYTATQSGQVNYSVTRAGNTFTALAYLTITVLGGPPPPTPTPPTDAPGQTPPQHDNDDSDDDDSDSDDSDDSDDSGDSDDRFFRYAISTDFIANGDSGGTDDDTETPVEDKDAAPEAGSATKPTPATEPGLFAGLVSPWSLGGLAALIALLLFLVARRRTAGEDDVESPSRPG